MTTVMLGVDAIGLLCAGAVFGALAVVCGRAGAQALAVWSNGNRKGFWLAGFCFVAVCVVLLWFGKSPNDAIDYWTMVVAYATIALVLFASFALAASIRANSSALEIDKNNAIRIELREKRDAVPLAVAIQHEIQRALGFVDTIALVRRQHANAPIDACKEMAANRERAMTSTLAENISELGCFDADTGKKVAGALTMSRIIYDTLRINEEYIELRAPQILTAVHALSQNTKRTFHEADEALARYSGIASTPRV